MKQYTLDANIWKGHYEKGKQQVNISHEHKCKSPKQCTWRPKLMKHRKELL